MTSFIKGMLKEIAELRSSVRINYLKNDYNFFLQLFDTSSIYIKKVSINETDQEQSLFYKEIKRVIHGRGTD